MRRFRDRVDAGRLLAAQLLGETGNRPVVVALPRGGVVVGAEVATALDCPLEVLVARKLGAPYRPELAVGAIAERGIRVVDEDMAAAVGMSAQQLEAAAERESVELARRVRRYRGDRPLPLLHGRCALLVDDGLATGLTARAGLRALRELRPARLVLAVPVCSPDTAAAMRSLADQVVCVLAPRHLTAVGLWYEDFTQTTDDQVMARLAAVGAAVGEA